MHDEGRDEENFRLPEQPKEKGKGVGGRRVGAGRKRVHDGGYKNVRDRLWKSLAVHTEVFEEWTRVREECDFYILPDFPKPAGCPQDQTFHFPPFCVFASPAAA